MPRDSRPTAALRPAQVGTALAAAVDNAIVASPVTAMAGVAAIGIDVVDTIEFAHNLKVGGQGFASRVFTPAEREFCGARADQLAARFAAKEAIAKVLGTGFRGLRPNEIEIRTSPEGVPTVALSGGAAAAAVEAGLESIVISMTREGPCAAAVAVGVQGT